MPTTDAQGRTISDDGHYWWDGTAWQLIRPAGKNFLDSFADSVEGAVRKVEGTQGGAPIVSVGSSTPTDTPGAAGVAPAVGTPESVPAAQPQAAAQPLAAAQPQPATPAIPAADLHAYLGALKVTGVVTEAEFADISQRIRARG